MKRSDIVRSIQVKFKHMRTTEADAVMDIVTDMIKDSVADGNRVVIRGFGAFLPRPRANKMGYNPSTGLPMRLPASTTILFKAGQQLNKKING